MGNCVKEISYLKYTRRSEQTPKQKKMTTMMMAATATVNELKKWQTEYATKKIIIGCEKRGPWNVKYVEQICLLHNFFFVFFLIFSCILDIVGARSLHTHEPFSELLFYYLWRARLAFFTLFFWGRNMHIFQKWSWTLLNNGHSQSRANKISKCEQNILRILIVWAYLCCV